MRKLLFCTTICLLLQTGIYAMHESGAKWPDGNGDNLREQQGQSHMQPEDLKDQLASAVFNAREQQVKELIECGVDVNVPLYCNEPALCWACRFNQIVILKLLLPYSRKNTVNFCDRIPLTWALRHHNREIIKLLIESGAHIKETDIPKACPYPQIKEYIQHAFAFQNAQDRVAFILHVVEECGEREKERPTSVDMCRNMLRIALIGSIRDVFLEGEMSEKTLFFKFFCRSRCNRPIRKIVDAALHAVTEDEVYSKQGKKYRNLVFSFFDDVERRAFLFDQKNKAVFYEVEKFKVTLPDKALNLFKTLLVIG